MSKHAVSGEQLPENRVPKISVGMPVWNGDKTLSAVINSILGQTFTDFELIISDNESSDTTEAICRAYVENDKRIKYFRQESNIGAIKNFQFVLSNSIGTYFMWAAADDLRSSDYIEENVKQIERSPLCVFSASPNCFEGDEADADKFNNFEIKGDFFNRIVGFLDFCLKSHACFYAVIKREALKKFLTQKDNYLGFDWTTIIELLEQGEFHRAQRGRLVLGRTGASMQPDFIKKREKLYF